MNMRLRMAAGLGAMVLVVGGINTAPLAAQVQVTPFFASYYPVGNLGQGNDTEGNPWEALQSQGLGFGAAFSYMFSDALGVEIGGSYIFSNAVFRTCGAVACGATAPGLLKGGVILGQLSLKFRPRGTNFFLVLGPALAYRSGKAWGADWFALSGSEKMGFGGMAGLGVIARVAPKLAVDVRVEVYGYSFDVDGADGIPSLGTNFSSKFRPDVVLKVGLPFPAR